MKPPECDLCWPFECSGRHIEEMQILISDIEKQARIAQDPEIRDAWRQALIHAHKAGSLYLAQRNATQPGKHK
jgi:hypothetical protein